LRNLLLKGELKSLFFPDCEPSALRGLTMAYQYVREPLRAEEADRLCHACQTTEEKLVLWTLLDTGLRVSELCGLTPQQLLWQQKALRISGKGGPLRQAVQETGRTAVPTAPSAAGTLLCPP
jgi:integrase